MPNNNKTLALLAHIVVTKLLLTDVFQKPDSETNQAPYSKDLLKRRLRDIILRELLMDNPFGLPGLEDLDEKHRQAFAVEADEVLFWILGRDELEPQEAWGVLLGSGKL